ncbi:septum formation initiator [Actinocatenispora rupis]|uniref:Septum formation initiator n=1 Tax=Actinocatenispora rupis TaxID=519421 RepID=A0A8J3J0R6_9ACTN|nr:septum formation initiator [Actinocatenispora rupis]
MAPDPSDPSTSPSLARPLVVTADARLLDELLQLAVASCGEVDVAHDAVAARRHWRSASLVVIGVDAASSCVRAKLPYRSDVVLVARVSDGAESADDPAFQAAGALGADHVVVLPAAAAWLTERFGSAGTARRDEAPVIGVIGGRGGAGASVLAAGLAISAARVGRRPMLVDADPLGGGVDLLLGWESTAGLRWPELSAARGRVDVAALYGELPRRGELVVVSWDRGDTLDLPVEAMEATLGAGRRGSDLVVVDLPRHLDEPAVRAAQVADEVLMVVTADIRGCASAARMAAQIGPHCRALRVVVRGPAPGRLRVADVGQALGLPVAGSLRPEPDLAVALEDGEPPAGSGKGPLAEFCERLVAELRTPTAPRQVA